MGSSSPLSSSLSLVAAAVVASAATTYWVMKRYSSATENEQDAIIPSELLASPYAKELTLAVRLAKKGMLFVL